MRCHIAKLCVETWNSIPVTQLQVVAVEVAIQLMYQELIFQVSVKYEKFNLYMKVYVQ
jgi:hypothetical protein